MIKTKEISRNKLAQTMTKVANSDAVASSLNKTESKKNKAPRTRTKTEPLKKSKPQVITSMISGYQSNSRVWPD